MRSRRCLLAVLLAGVLMSGCGSHQYGPGDIELRLVPIEWTNGCETPVTIQVRSGSGRHTIAIGPGETFTYTSHVGSVLVLFPEMGYHENEPDGGTDGTWVPQPPLDRCPDGDYVQVEWTNECQVPVWAQISSRYGDYPDDFLVEYPAVFVPPGDPFESRIYLRNQAVLSEQDQEWRVSLVEMSRSSPFFGFFSEARLRELFGNHRWIIKPYTAACPSVSPYSGYLTEYGGQEAVYSRIAASTSWP